VCKTKRRLNLDKGKANGQGTIDLKPVDRAEKSKQEKCERIDRPKNGQKMAVEEGVGKRWHTSRHTQPERKTMEWGGSRDHSRAPRMGEKHHPYIEAGRSNNRQKGRAFLQREKRTERCKPGGEKVQNPRLGGTTMNGRGIQTEGVDRGKCTENYQIKPRRKRNEQRNGQDGPANQGWSAFSKNYDACSGVSTTSKEGRRPTIHSAHEVSDP